MPADKQRILDYAPSGKVPILVDDGVTIWDSLAIMEYLADRFPRRRRVAGGSRGARACPLDLVGDALRLYGAPQRVRHEHPSSGSRQGTVGRCDEQCRARSTKSGPTVASATASGGPFLFGRFSAADAMFAPVVHRFLTYAVDVSAGARKYMTTMTEFAPFKEWTNAALKETLVIEKFEGD